MKLFTDRSSLRLALRFDSLKEGQSVEFEVETGAKDPRAVDVRLDE